MSKLETMMNVVIGLAYVAGAVCVIKAIYVLAHGGAM